MKNYLITVITVAICVGIYNIISPGLHGIEKYSKMIGMLVLLCVIVSPIREVINTFDENGFDNIKESILDSNNESENEYSEIFKEYLNSYSVEKVKKEVCDILFEKYEIPDEECEVKIYTQYQEGNLIISNMQIVLSGKSIFKNPYVIEEYFETLLSCSCEVLIK